jgi:hypothetical protein
MKIIYITEASLARKREAGLLKMEVAYEVTAPAHGRYAAHTQFAWSPDGIGMYWYDTEDELLANHG